MDNSRFWWQAAAGPGPDPGPGDPGDPIGQSLRFRGTQYLVSPALGSVTTYTISFWAKISEKSNNYFGPANSSSYFATGYPSDRITYAVDNFVYFQAIRLLRDYSAWQHFVVKSSVNGPQVFINGVEVTATTLVAGRPALNMNPFYISRESSFTANWTVKGYMAEWHFIDGQELDPTTFGRFNANGVWVPVDPKKDGDTAWYGTNGFRLTFADPNDIGKDYSGNGNDFTATGFELADTSSPTYDVMQDSPTQNYATGNPIPGYNSSTEFVGGNTLRLANANLSELASSQYAGIAPTTGYLASGKWAFKFVPDGSTYHYVGIVAEGSDWQNCNRPDFPGWSLTLETYPGSSTVFGKSSQTSNGAIDTNINYGTTPTGVRTPVVVVLDIDNHQVRWDINGVQGAWMDYTVALPANTPVTFYISGKGDNSFDFGQQQSFTPPAGFEALSTANLPEANLPDEITGTFTGNSSADGPFVYTECIPARIQYGTIDVKYQDRLGQTDVDFLSNGFKVRSTTSNSGTVNYTVTTTHDGGEYDGFKVPFQSPAPAVSN